MAAARVGGIRGGLARRLAPPRGWVHSGGRNSCLANYEVEMAASSVSPRGAVTRIGVFGVVALGLVIVLALLVLGAYLYDHSRRDVIAAGVRVAGLSVGGLHEVAARCKLHRDLVARLN